MDVELRTSAGSLQVGEARHLVAAEGYIELGMFAEANEELDAMDPRYRTLPDAISLKFCVHAGLGEWEVVQTLAQKLAEQDPENAQWSVWWAMAARQAQSLEDAKAILLGALEQHPNEPTIHYNLSCYESRLSHFTQARRHLARAIQLDARLKLMALQEQDLQPLWEKLDGAA